MNVERVAKGSRPPFHHCTACGQELRNTVAWLELNSRTGKYSADAVPPAESQGCFPFGVQCAEAWLAKAMQS